MAVGMVWLQFAACVALIGIAGTYLSRYGDVIAEKTGLGGTWIGVILLATVTSLPELITGVSSVTLAGTPNIAVGDVLGSCVFNLMILVILDFLQREESVYTRASQGHILSAGFGLILISTVAFNLHLAVNGGVPHYGHIGVYTPVILLLYAVAMRTVFFYERNHREAFHEERAERYADVTLRQAGQRYALAAVVVVAAGVWLPFVGDQLARLMGWHQTFVGTLFVAAATSVPEVVVTIAALRIGAIDLAISNLLGSNVFNIAILAVDDLLFMKGPLLSNVSPMHTVSALSAVMMTGIVIVGLFYRPRKRFVRGVGWAALFLLVIYLLNTSILYLRGG